MRNETVMLFVGPRGSSDERASKLFTDVNSGDVLPVLTEQDVVSTVEMTPGVVGILPLEDNIRGEFRNVYDLLVEKTRVSRIVRTATLEEQIDLQALDPNQKQEKIFSHPSILAKYSNFFLESGIEGVATVNTSVACELVRNQGNPAFGALAPSVVGRHFKLQSHSSFEHLRETVSTRYGLLGHPDAHVDGIENWFSVLYVEPANDRSGTLSEILTGFKKENINLTRLRSQNRPDGQPHGFILEMEGHPQDVEVRNALRSLEEQKVAMKLVGVFPSGAGSSTPENVVYSKGMKTLSREIG